LLVEKKARNLSAYQLPNLHDFVKALGNAKEINLYFTMLALKYKFLLVIYTKYINTSQSLKLCLSLGNITHQRSTFLKRFF